MAKYLDTSQISSELMQLIKEAKEKIVLVTYSLQVNSQIQERLKTKSKQGTISEITLIYGNTKLKSSELKWMEEIDDLRIIQKKNLHAKCYINENKAIISSMNLYDYSQTTNVEMGILITKVEDTEAYEKMMEDIADLRVNGTRQKISDLETGSTDKVTVQASVKILEDKGKVTLSYSQQIKKELLEYYRSEKSAELKENEVKILSDETIFNIITNSNLTKNVLKEILNNDKKFKQLGTEIMDWVERYKDFTIGKIIDRRYQNDEFSYDQVKMEILGESNADWYDTKRELPKKNQIVAVLLNRNWFNDYILLDPSEIKETYTKPSAAKDYSNSNYKTTKELSESTGINSRELNAAMVAKGLMTKNNNDWYPTAKGEKYGAIQKEGQFGKFVIWPEEILREAGLN